MTTPSMREIVARVREEHGPDAPATAYADGSKEHRARVEDNAARRGMTVEAYLADIVAQRTAEALASASSARTASLVERIRG